MRTWGGRDRARDLPAQNLECDGICLQAGERSKKAKRRRLKPEIRLIPIAKTRLQPVPFLFRVRCVPEEPGRKRQDAVAPQMEDGLFLRECPAKRLPDESA